MVDERMIGRVLRASTRGFTCGTHSTHISDHHDFGAFVKVPVANTRERQVQAIGLIYKVEIMSDPLVNELVMGEFVPENVLRDQRENRMVPVEISCLSIGFMTGDNLVVQSLPPRPPMSLSEVYVCESVEVDRFVQQKSFFRLILGASEVPVDDLLAAAVRHASAIYQPDYPDLYGKFLLESGHEIARQLSGDLKRLSHILALIHPNTYA